MMKNNGAFKFWSQKVLPLVYDDSLSYYEVLSKVVKYINDLIENQKLLEQEVLGYGTSVEEVKTEIKLLSDELEKIKNGDYVSLYLDSIIKWIDKNIQELVARIVKYVMFGLSSDGHFVAYIPESWDFIEFDTVIDNESDLYGHLIMRW